MYIHKFIAMNANPNSFLPFLCLSLTNEWNAN